MTEDKIDDVFGGMMQSDSERLQIAKELFSEENIDMKTEMSDQEINIFARVEFIKETFKIKSLQLFINKFEKLRISKLRQGRKEFVETMKNEEKTQGLEGLSQMFKSGKL